MNNDERKHRYAMMGVVAYVEQEIIAYERRHHKLPGFAILGSLEWREILGSQDDEEFTVAGIPCIPDLTKPQGVFLT